MKGAQAGFMLVALAFLVFMRKTRSCIVWLLFPGFQLMSYGKGKMGFLFLLEPLSRLDASRKKLNLFFDGFTSTRLGFTYGPEISLQTCFAQGNARELLFTGNKSFLGTGRKK